MRLDDLPAVELAQRVEQGTRIASDAASVLAGAAVEGESQPRVP
jgi:hypothetical protein